MNGEQSELLASFNTWLECDNICSEDYDHLWHGHLKL
jgi:hypothetical protein